VTWLLALAMPVIAAPAWGQPGGNSPDQRPSNKAAAAKAAPAQGDRAAANAPLQQTGGGQQTGGVGLWGLVEASGSIGFVIIGLSVAAMALAIEHLWSIRKGSLMPAGLAEQVREHLRTGQVNQALQQCQLRPSVLSEVLQAGLAELEGKWSTLEKAMEDVTAQQSARLMRKVEYLAVIANLAPMLGLLGTVVGLIVAFQQVASTGGRATAADLAEGIYLALVTTVEGLVVAIPCLGAYALFRNRVDELVAQTAYAAIGVFQPFKRGGRGESTARDESYRGPVGRKDAEGPRS